MSSADESLPLAISRDWGVPDGVREEDLIEHLALRVLWMMRHDYERLLNALYLLDVPEQRFREAQALGSAEETARGLAQSILEREREKLESRRRYRREGRAERGADGGGLKRGG